MSRVSVGRIPPRRHVLVIPLGFTGSFETSSTSFVEGSWRVYKFLNVEELRKLGLKVLSGYYSIEWTLTTSDSNVPAEGFSVVRMPRSVDYVLVENPVRSTTATTFGTPGDENYYSEVVPLDSEAVAAFNEGTRPSVGIQFKLRTTGNATARIDVYSAFLVLEVEVL